MLKWAMTEMRQKSMVLIPLNIKSVKKRLKKRKFNFVFCFLHDRNLQSIRSTDRSDYSSVKPFQERRIIGYCDNVW